MGKTRVSVVGASGYTGGEALRLLLSHPNVDVVQATSEHHIGKYVHSTHPNLRKATALKFTSMDDLANVDILFLALPHGISSRKIDYFKSKADRIIDKGSDFRLRNPGDYDKYYQFTHPRPELLAEFAYGIPELHRPEIKAAQYVAVAGCNSTATILALYPLYKQGIIHPERTVVEVKVGSSEAGSQSSEASHHPERSGCLRSYAPTGHRHIAEILQELNAADISFSATAYDSVRGILATSHVFLKNPMEDKDVWQAYREFYSGEPFIRLVKESGGIYRYPEPKILAGTNYCDIGFEIDRSSNRMVVMSAIDNLVKGASGQAVQCMNLMMGWDERMGLEFAGLHPI